MTIRSQDCDLYPGTSDTLSFTLTDANGSPFVMPGSGNIEWRMSQSSGDIDVDCILRKDLSNGILLQDSVAEVSLTRFDTDVPPGFYFHQLSVLDLNIGDVAVAAIGTVWVHRALRIPCIETSTATMRAGAALICNAAIA